MAGEKLDLRSLTMDELTKVINLYPWFGGARKELCARMAKVGGSEWGRTQYSDAAMYVASRTLISDIMRTTRREDYSDKDVERLIKDYIKPDAGAICQSGGEDDQAGKPQAPQDPPAKERGGEVSGYPSQPPVARDRKLHVAGGDFFSPEQYAAVRKDEDGVFSNFRTERSDDPEGRRWEDPGFGFCTETLAAIYADQGYFAEAKKIYPRLILRYPEKSAYFASLIEKLRQQEN